jgi:hypothetical protein
MKLNLTPVLVALIVSFAAVMIAHVVADAVIQTSTPPRWVPIGVGQAGRDRGFTMDTVTGLQH